MIQTFRPTFLPRVESDAPLQAGRLVLRDGSRLELRTASESDVADLDAFLARLDSTERADVGRSLGVESSESAEFARQIAESGSSGRGFVARSSSPDDGDEGAGDAWGFAAYRITHSAGQNHSDEATVTLAVDPARRRLGMAGLLLERLMVLAAQHGVDRLVGLAHEDNRALVELFKRDGFDLEQEREGDVLRMTFSTRALPSPSGLADADDLGARVYAAASLHSLFHPRSVAVVGASRERSSVGYRILDALVKSEFQGPVFPVNPKADFVGSIRAYPSMRDIGGPVDLAVIAVPARLVCTWWRSAPRPASAGWW